MKTILRIFIVLGFLLAIPALRTFSQMKINNDGSAPDASAMLDVKSEAKGMLIPRMTSSQRSAITSPANGLLIYQTNTPIGFYYYNGTAWKLLGSGSGDQDNNGFGNVIDINGNIYPTVKIHGQEWMAENLRATHFGNGEEIPNVIPNILWTNNQGPKRCWYNDNTTIYGILYNFYAVNDPRSICPPGWHVPSASEWTMLVDHLSGQDYAGARLKAAVLWQALYNASNETGFSALPGGSRDIWGTFSEAGSKGTFWSASELNPGVAHMRYMNANNQSATAGTAFTESGFSVRCVKN